MAGDTNQSKQKAATPRMRLGASGERLASGWLEAATRSSLRIGIAPMAKPI
jgi:hypothetical protein